MAEPVLFRVEHPGPRNRLTGIFRPILVIPHALLVGGPFFGVGQGSLRTGALGLVAYTIAILDWFAILFTGHPLAGLQGLKRLYLRWRARVLAYACLMRDEYPPFGDGDYPASLELADEPPTRNVSAVAFRLILLIPHLVLVSLLMLAQLVVVIASWASILFTGRLSDGLWRFSRDTLAYLLRIEAYGLLIHDEYPPFRFAEPEQTPGRPVPTEPGPAEAPGQTHSEMRA
jgi:hypothetical protein